MVKFKAMKNKTTYEAAKNVPARSVEEGDKDFPNNNTPPIEAYENDHRWAMYNPKEEQWYKHLYFPKDNSPGSKAGNLEMIFRNDTRWDGVLGYCDFSYQIMFLKKPPIHHMKPEIQDPDISRLRVWFHRNYWPMQEPAKSEIQDAIIIEAQRNRFHPIRQYLGSIKYDGEPRLDTWLKRAFESPAPSDYLQIVGSKFLIGAVARVMQPGCKMDNMLILEGSQGKGKSTAFKILFGDWFSDAPIPLGDKEAYLLMQGVWGYEMAELDALSKVDTTTVKAIISQRVDKFRPPYGTNVMNFDRQTVFVGTTNQDEYLKDYSGNRRFWPLLCLNVDIEWLEANRDQLWAEAFERYKANDTWWIDNEDDQILVETEQDTRLQRDAWEDIIQTWLSVNTAKHFTAAEILTGALNIDASHIQRVHQNRLVPIMKSLGWKKKPTRLRDDLGRSRVLNAYIRPEDEMEAPF